MLEKKFGIMFNILIFVNMLYLNIRLHLIFMFYNGFLRCEMDSVCNHLGYCEDFFSVDSTKDASNVLNIKTAKMLAVACRLYTMIFA